MGFDGRVYRHPVTQFARTNLSNISFLVMARRTNAQGQPFVLVIVPPLANAQTDRLCVDAYFIIMTDCLINNVDGYLASDVRWVNPLEVRSWNTLSLQNLSVNSRERFLKKDYGVNPQHENPE